MKILRISGRNLASLAGEFTVDFEHEPLASAGLFAISGPTGAGKSTLLDALCLALYDATPRLVKVVRGGTFLPDVGADTVSAQDPRTLLRRGAGEGHAEVDFVGNDNLRYRARWSVRRSRGKVSGGLQTSQMSLHRLPELAALGGTKTEVAKEIVQRVGLSFEQFTRAVLLAQNEFSAFLKTDENERGELLETLTGSAIYSAISKRAYERFKAEQSATQQLGARLADQSPLTAEARAALEEQCTAAEAAAAQLEHGVRELEHRLRWRQQADKLAQDEALAAAKLAEARGALDAAGARRMQIDTLDAVAPARPLLADHARLTRELQQGEQTIAASTAEVQQADTLQQQAALALAAAAARVQAAEQEQRAAGAQLDQAKALDASIAALAPAHRKATLAVRAASQELDGAMQALRSANEQLEATRAAQLAADTWLDEHRAWERRSEQWPRWDTLLGQAAHSAAQADGLAAQLAGAGEHLKSAANADEQAAATLAQATTVLAAQEAARQHAIGELAQFDGEQLRAEREQLGLRRDALDAAEKSWNALASLRARLVQTSERRDALSSAIAAASAALDAASADAPVLAAALGQAESSLAAAELACAASVVELRATLAEGAPCPVCGSEAHPYQHQSAALDNMLASLRKQVSERRAEAQHNLALQAAQRALLASSEPQLAGVAAEEAVLAQAVDGAATQWNRHALDAAAPQGQDSSAWFQLQLAALKAASAELDASERAARTAAGARDAAQQACDKCAAEHARSQQHAQAARATLASARDAHQALAEQHAQCSQRTMELLSALDGAFEDNGWQQAWHADPAAFQAARSAEVAEWRLQLAAHASRATASITLEAQCAAAAQRAQQAAQFHAAAAEEFARAEADTGAKLAQRAALFEGRAAREVEAAFGLAIEQARAESALRQNASQQAAQSLTRAGEALAQATARHRAQQVQAAAAGQALNSWIAQYALAHPELLPVADFTGLVALLSTEPAWIAAERSAMRALDAGASNAATIRAERQRLRALHLQAAPPGESIEAGVLNTALEAAAATRKQAQDALGALRLQLAQDELRRAGAAAMMAEIERQQGVEMRWARLNELIGSADGKKFRNYAQQFTLDVLLGYANSHLQHLARRYRLERVMAVTGPSLGLLVRDQDMGGEIRSVNSLSGGESFLVSLALALGLASLSSNRVRVESLFIDEGFGSLDADTLRVAMDALDGLQSMGRKVGVISHVQEMTERIATRIVVQPAGGGTSSVTVQ